MGTIAMVSNIPLKLFTQIIDADYYGSIIKENYKGINN